jgi:polyhydroxybutyrate depolymerase
MELFARRTPVLHAMFLATAVVLAGCAGGDLPPSETGGAGTTGGSGTSGSAGTSGGGSGTSGSAGTSGGGAGTSGSAGTFGGGSGTSGGAGTSGSGRGGTMGNAGTTGNAGTMGNAGTTGAAGSMGGRGGRGGGTAGGRGGTTAAGGTTGSAGTTGTGGATPSSGCGKAPPASNRYTMDVSGTMREYILALPANYDMNRPYPLVFAWHPLGGSAQSTAGSGNSGYYGVRGASNNGAILVSPEGLQQNGSGNRGWWNTGGGDIAFARAMIDRFKGEMCVDAGRIFSTGFSFGGMMSYAVGCAGLVRAIAPMAGNSQVSGCTAGTTPVAMMGFHGDDDTVVAISGGRTARDVFVQRNGCMTQTMPTQPSWCDGVSSSNMPCSCVSYQGCMTGYPAIWCEFNGPHTPAPNSAATIWSFFSQF